MILNRGPDPLGYLHSILICSPHISEEFFTPVAGRPVSGAKDFANNMTHITNRLASNYVALPVINLLEEVQVHHHDHDWLRIVARRCSAYLAVQFGEQAASGPEAGQLVPLNHLVQPLLKLGLKLVQHRKLQEMLPNLYLV